MSSAETYPLAASSPPRDPRLVFEVVAVLCLTLLPSIYGAFAAIAWDEPSGARSLRHRMVSHVVYGVSYAIPLLYVMWKSGDRFATFGVVRPRASDAALGVGLFLAIETLYFASSKLAALAGRHPLGDPLFDGFARHVTHARDAGDVLAVVLGASMVGFKEELVVRGYLVPRFERLFGSTARAIALSSVLFATYHVDRGVYATANILLSGVAKGLVFAWCRRLWPVAIAHALHDFFLFL